MIDNLKLSVDTRAMECVSLLESFCQRGVAMDIRTCIETRVSTRLFNNTPIPHETLYDIMDAARFAPSPKNRQPWRFAVLTGPEKDTVVHICRNGLQAAPQKAGHLMGKETASEYNTYDIIDQAPVLILVFNAFPSKETLNHYNRRFDDANMQAIGAAIENMLLRATELGVKSLWIGDILTEAKLLEQRYFCGGALASGIVLGFSEMVNRHLQRNALSDLIIFDGG